MNQKVGIIITVIAIVGIILLLRSKKETPLPPITGPVVIFGDSLVAGVGATPGNDIASILSRRLGVEVINAGLPGDSTESALARLKGDVAVRDPGLVVVLVGGNDFLRRYPKVTVLNNIRAIIDEIRQTGAEVVLVGVSRMVYDKDYEVIAKEKGIEFVPHILDWTAGQKELMYDTVHPNDKGYEIFADKMEPVIRNLLER